MKQKLETFVHPEFKHKFKVVTTINPVTQREDIVIERLDESNVVTSSSHVDELQYNMFVENTRQYGWQQLLCE